MSLEPNGDERLIRKTTDLNNYNYNYRENDDD